MDGATKYCIERTLVQSQQKSHFGRVNNHPAIRAYFSCKTAFSALLTVYRFRPHVVKDLRSCGSVEREAIGVKIRDFLEGVIIDNDFKS